jgi:hypothetical protein
MGNELFDEIIPDAWHAATAIELSQFYFDT